MTISKIKSKKSGEQSVTIPREFSIDDDKVYVKKQGGVVYLIPFHSPWESLFESTSQFSDDFMNKRSQPPIELRESLDP
jgi:virulence-associated protein VagC